MLEVIHLTKLYKTKGGADVRALDDVSLRFPEKGMVFLLGRSGSGKSTLLNVCGGLDSPTSGEIVVKGRSSRDFTQSDFDSYRNTFVGFVFQEYNILDEFSVEDNIALALELQGKPKDKKTIEKLLADVDLSGYAKRKPNTLSGGQKQRIAIARALVKNPEIIMADEPTGALDSSTGKQVFDTLKKLSENKLVIVVSHDRDFAEQYGDRIVELKDGKIISDVSKARAESAALSANLTVSGDTLCVKSGAALSDTDFEAVKAFLTRTEGSVVISGDQREISLFKQVSRLHDDGSKEVFRPTDEKQTPKKEYSPDDSRFIRSKLPARHAVKIGVSGMKSKPLRLFFTILLCTISFVMFGLLSTMMVYDEEATMKSNLRNSDYTTMSVSKRYRLTIERGEGENLYSWDQERETFFTPAEVEAYQQRFPGAMPAIRWQSSFHNSNQGKSVYYENMNRYVLSASETDFSEKMVCGGLPQEDDEICISSYQADCFIKNGLLAPETKEEYTLTNRNSLIEKKAVLNNISFTIVGIYDCGKIPSAYDAVKDSTESAEIDYDLQYSFQEDIKAYEAAIFTHSFFDSLKRTSSGESLRELFSSKQVYIQDSDYYDCYYASFGKFCDKIPVTFFEEGKTQPDKGEVVVPIRTFSKLLEIALANRIPDLTVEELWKLDKQLNYGSSSAPSINDKLLAIERGYNDYTGEPLSEEMTLEYLSDIFSFMKEWELSLKEFTLEDSYENPLLDYPLTTVGISLASGYLYNIPDSYILTDEETEEMLTKALYDPNDEREITNYKVPEDAVYDAIILPYDRSAAQTDFLVANTGKWQADDSGIRLDCALVSAVQNASGMVDTLYKVFLYAGLVIAAFSALLLCNFISISISYKKKEIGILRAVGARSFDVFKIFFSESLVISVICILLSCAGGIVACHFINAEVSALLAGVSIFVFGPLSVLMLVGVALVTALVATFLPVYHTAKKKPVESIRAL